MAAVSQTIYWLGLAGMAKMTGTILIEVVIREIAPILVGILLLGRNGMLSVTELGLLTTGGKSVPCRRKGWTPSCCWSCRVCAGVYRRRVYAGYSVLLRRTGYRICHQPVVRRGDQSDLDVPV